MVAEERRRVKRATRAAAKSRASRALHELIRADPGFGSMPVFLATAAYLASANSSPMRFTPFMTSASANA
jgi:hypothetical protein